MRYRLVVVGTSLGGLRAVRVLLSALPATFALPIAIVQHRTADAGDALQQLLQQHCALKVVDAADKQPIDAGFVYLAPAGYHLLIDSEHLALSTEEPVAFAQPSIDVLFESAAQAFRQRVIGVVLTGTGHDGAAGLAAIRAHGGLALVESPATAEAAEMPVAARDASPGAQCLPLGEIAPRLIELASPPSAAAGTAKPGESP